MAPKCVSRKLLLEPFSGSSLDSPLEGFECLKTCILTVRDGMFCSSKNSQAFERGNRILREMLFQVIDSSPFYCPFFKEICKLQVPIT